MTCLKEETDQARRLEALGTLKDWCEDMNFAIGNFETIQLNRL